METVLRTIAVYLFLLVAFRLAGRRTVGQITTFDFILLLIISEATQQAMIAKDYSITNAYIVILTLFALDAGFTYWKHKSERAQRWLEGVPLVLVDNGRPVKEVLDNIEIDEKDILSAARERQGLERMDQIKFAVLELNGSISIIPK